MSVFYKVHYHQGHISYVPTELISLTVAKSSTADARSFPISHCRLPGNSTSGIYPVELYPNFLMSVFYKVHYHQGHISYVPTELISLAVAKSSTADARSFPISHCRLPGNSTSGIYPVELYPNFLMFVFYKVHYHQGHISYVPTELISLTVAKSSTADARSFPISHCRLPGNSTSGIYPVELYLNFLMSVFYKAHLEDYLGWPYLGGAAGALVLTGVAAYFATKPNPETPLMPLDCQSRLLPGAELIRVSKFYKDSKEGRFISYIHEDVRTLYDAFRRGAKESNNGQCLGWREGPTKPYQWLHYNEALLRAKNLGSGLISCGLSPGPQTLVGLYSQNCPEWILTEQACYSYSLVVVPLYDTLGPDACAYIINQADISLVICEDDKKCNLLLDKAPRCLRKLIVVKETRPATNQRAKNRGVELLRFEDVERLGSQRNHPEVPPRPSDLCTVCYTSGTTGNPKGVMLTHQNVMAGVCAVILQLGDHKPTARDVMISFLPLAHMLERCCENGMYIVGGSVGFYSGDIKRLPDDMKALRPTVMPAVPRLLNRLYDRVQAELQNSFLKKMLFNMGMRSKEAEIKKSIVRSNSIWDRIAFRKIQDSMGGRLRLMVVGSAPLAGNVLTFARCALGCLIVEGYGQTECCAPITLTIQGDHVPEHVGPPVACCCVKLVDVPEMEYFAISNQGEVCVKGTNVFVGYYRNPEKTAEVVDEQGWHHTGDIGMWLPNGCLKIIDRKKHIFKLSQGEYIVPEKIENIYIRSQYVHQVFVHGESLKSCVVAIVVPDVDVVKCWALENKIPGTLSVLCANPEVKRLIHDDMIAWGKEAGLKSFEQVKDIYLHPDPFSVQNGLLTPTLKTKRPQLKAYFKPQIEDLYQHLD